MSFRHLLSQPVVSVASLSDSPRASWHKPPPGTRRFARHPTCPYWVGGKKQWLLERFGVAGAGRMRQFTLPSVAEDSEILVRFFFSFSWHGRRKRRRKQPTFLASPAG